ncbi:helix-turn-helix domain-containing protein [Actinocorallia sp. A-T 12471]|uniref:helix-turn-helix domain-containing protein n=1 Tax=Actinocorallia sp. A-T 12471 TaxID=3089813 RepID=UPI0029D3CB0B|nr:helix-turn-helix domain-containing protein [Actinocorallia sp. A-T 12471]MDX6744468.1 helix-turn-helix domain-containing protein [Actinocorallia sp. A-T 12471]
MTVSTPKSLEPGQVSAQDAGRALRRIKDFLAAYPGDDDVRVHVELAGEDALVLPRDTVTMFAYMLAQLAEGRGVTLVPNHAELTTRQAADVLNVSRPYLIALLEDDKIPYRLVGRHRRIRFDDLMAYKHATEARTRKAADALITLTEDLDLY